MRDFLESLASHFFHNGQRMYGVWFQLYILAAIVSWHMRSIGGTGSPVQDFAQLFSTLGFRNACMFDIIMYTASGFHFESFSLSLKRQDVESHTSDALIVQKFTRFQRNGGKLYSLGDLEPWLEQVSLVAYQITLAHRIFIDGQIKLYKDHH